ncbi:MAG: hypothetical protein LWW93_11280 [Hyphomicrobiales bacterium]|nr:hypothetical protein [Hyphomicrobiales bacterium]
MAHRFSTATDPDAVAPVAPSGPALGLGRRSALAGVFLAAALAVPLAPQRAAVVVEERALLEIAAAASKGEGGRAAEEDRVLAAEIERLRSDDFLRRAVATRSDGAPDADGVTPAERDLEALRENLAIERVDRSRILVLRLKTADAAEGLRQMGLVHDHWIAALLEARARAGVEVDRRFAPEVDAARRRVAEAEAVEVALARPDGGQDDLAAMRARRLDAETRLKRLEDMARAGDKGADRAVDLAPTAGLQRLREKRGQLRARLAELSVTYLANHPLMKEATEQLADLRAEIRAELPRAVAEGRASLAALDRRIAETAAETTASIPVTEASALAAARVDLAATTARRDAARAEAARSTAVDARVVVPPSVVAAPSRLPAFLLSAALALLAVLVFVGGRRRPRAVATAASIAALEEAIAAPMPTPVVETVAPPPAVAPPPSRAVEPIDVDAPARAEAHRHVLRRAARRLWPEIACECEGANARIVVVSTTDAACAGGAASALAEAAGGAVGLVDLVGLGREHALGVADLLDGRAAFSEVVRRDPATGAWRVGAGRRKLADADFADPALAGLLDAFAVDWGDIVVDAGRLDGGDGMATLLLAADVIVLAEEDAADPRALRAFAALVEAGRPTFVLAAREADADWASAA